MDIRWKHFWTFKTMAPHTGALWLCSCLELSLLWPTTLFSAKTLGTDISFPRPNRKKQATTGLTKSTKKKTLILTMKSHPEWTNDLLINYLWFWISICHSYTAKRSALTRYVIKLQLNIGDGWIFIYRTFDLFLGLTPASNRDPNWDIGRPR